MVAFAVFTTFVPTMQMTELFFLFFVFVLGIFFFLYGVCVGGVYIEENECKMNK